MSNERWTDERLDRLASLVESNARLAEKNARVHERHDRNFERIEQNIERIEHLAEKNEQKIGRIEQLIEKNTQAQERNQQDIERIEQLVESNARVIQALANTSAEAKEERDQLFQRMDRHQAEIVGLRTETARLLDLLFERWNQEDNSN